MKRILAVAFLICLAFSITVIETAIRADSKLRQIQMTINQKTALIDGKSVELETPPTIINGRTVVPLRFMQENAMSDSAKINWDSIEKKITLMIPIESIDSEVFSNMNREIERLKSENTKLKDEIDKLKRGELPPEVLVPPITYGPKNGIKFIVKSIVKEKDGIRLDVVVENISDTYCRFPASQTMMNLDGADYIASSSDPVFIEKISAGKRQPGYIRFLGGFAPKGIARFTFKMWPQNTLKYFDFNIKVDLDQSIPTKAR